MARVLCLFIGYVFGLFQTGFLIGKKSHVNLQEKGSKNLGTTNAMRVMGLKAGLLTFAGDVLKTMLAFWLCEALFGSGAPEKALLFGLYGATGAILGHNFPFYLHFHGGKGVACLCGLAFAMTLKIVPVPLGVFILTVLLTRYVSLGSLLSTAVLLIEVMVFGNLGLLSVGEGYLPEVYAVMIFLAALTYYRHRENIRRLLAGKENKLRFKKEKEK